MTGKGAVPDYGAHEPLMWGPAAEGERLANGKTLDVPGWVWTCTCGQTGYGYPTEGEAEQWCDAHLPHDDGSEGTL